MSQTAQFSIVIPTYARPTRLRSCLAALARSRFPRQAFEVIVVDEAARCRSMRLLRLLHGKLK